MLEINSNIPSFFIKGEDISNYTTFSIKAHPKYLVYIHDVSRLKPVYEFAYSNNLPVVILGWGSNVVFINDHFEGIVLINRLEHIDFSKKPEVIAQTGLTFNDFIRKCFENSLAGFENCYGIPGSLAGAIRGNAGSYKTEISDRIVSVEVFNPKTFTTSHYLKEELNFKYRSSRFKEDLKHIFLVSAKFNLEQIKKNQFLQIKSVMEEKVQLRKEKLPQGKNAGSFFKNPVIDNQVVPAGKLIEDAELKGLCVGGVSVSKQHANILENSGSATGEDLIEIESIIKTKVKERFGVDLQREVIYIDNKGNAY